MRNYLIVVCTSLDEEVDHLRTSHPGMHGFAYPLVVDNPDYEDVGFARKQLTWECDERDAPMMLEALTKKFPGSIVRAYSLTMEAERPFGEMKTKAVGKDGVTPF